MRAVDVISLAFVVAIVIGAAAGIFMRHKAPTTADQLFGCTFPQQIGRECP